MFKTKAFIWYILTILTIFGLYETKYEVQSLEAELRGLNKEILANQEALHVLNAEWVFLNHPERLEQLNTKYLNLVPLAIDKIVDADSLLERHEE